MSRRSLLLLPLALACTEYDIHRPSKQEKPVETDTGTPNQEAPDIQVEPESLDFGYVKQGCPSRPEDVTVLNVGTATLEVDSIEFNGSGSGSLEHDGGPLSLEPGDSTSFQVTFTPSATVEYSLNLLISSNDPDEPEVAVPVEGVGSEDAYYEQAWEQGVPGPVDILWVLDNSGSMSGEIQRVKDNFDSFTAEFFAMDLDFQMGVVTMDMDNPGDSGQLQGTPRWIDSSHSDPASAFRSVVDEVFAVTGSGSERGLDAVYAALSEPLISDHNVGFMRDYDEHGEEVAIFAIAVTDEDDDSTMQPSGFAPWFLGLKSDPEKAVLSAICGDPASSSNPLGGCMEWHGTDVLQAEAGAAYVDAADRTGGTWSSLCTHDFSDALYHLSLGAMGMRHEFLLDYPPSNLARTEVKVDGAEVGYSAIDGWTYDSGNVSIVFHGDALPPPAATVTAIYPYDGGC